MALFIYGTLLDSVLFARLAGDGPGKGVSAVLPDHKIMRTRRGNLPMLTAAPGESVQGILWRDLSDDQRARIDAYEVPFDFAPQDVAVMVGDTATSAAAYFPSRRVQTDGYPWNFDDWARDGQALAREAALEIGSYDPPLSAEALRTQWGMITKRASFRLRAADPVPADIRHKGGQVTITDGPHLHGNFFKFASLTLDHDTFHGRPSGTLSRETLVGTDAAFVLPYDPKTDCVLLVEQMRVGALVRGAANPWMLEPVAGMIDAGETPEEAALRETYEEAGLRDVTLEKMFQYYPSGGSATDYFYCYAGICDLGAPQTYTGGLASESEDLRLHILPYDTAFGLIASGEAEAGSLITMLLWLDRNRARLRDA